MNYYTSLIFEIIGIIVLLLLIGSAFWSIWEIIRLNRKKKKEKNDSDQVSELKSYFNIKILIKKIEIEIDKDDGKGNLHFKGNMVMNNYDKIKFDIKRKNRELIKAELTVDDHKVEYKPLPDDDKRDFGINEPLNIFRSYMFWSLKDVSFRFFSAK